MYISLKITIPEGHFIFFSHSYLHWLYNNYYIYYLWELATEKEHYICCSSLTYSLLPVVLDDDSAESSIRIGFTFCIGQNSFNILVRFVVIALGTVTRHWTRSPPQPNPALSFSRLFKTCTFCTYLHKSPFIWFIW